MKGIKLNIYRSFYMRKTMLGLDLSLIITTLT